MVPAACCQLGNEGGWERAGGKEGKEVNEAVVRTGGSNGGAGGQGSATLAGVTPAQIGSRQVPLGISNQDFGQGRRHLSIPRYPCPYLLQVDSNVEQRVQRTFMLFGTEPTAHRAVCQPPSMCTYLPTSH